MKRLFSCLVVLSSLTIITFAAFADSMPGMSGDSMPGMTAKPARTAAPRSGIQASAHGAAQPAPAQSALAQPAAVMPVMSGDTSGPWKTAAFALVAIILVGAVIIRRDRRATTIAMVVAAAVFVVGRVARGDFTLTLSQNRT